MTYKTITVSQLTEAIKMTLEGAPYLNNIRVSGEISDFTYRVQSGHMYFTLKDEFAVLRCVMFRYQNQKLTFKPQDGEKVVCTGRISLYAQSGQYQLYVDNILKEGVGDLYAEAEKLKKALAEKGLFDKKLKRPLKAYPKKIGVITSQTGDALRDIINITKLRFPLCELLVYPSTVQGKESLKTLLDGIDFFNKKNKVDTIIIGRGGGSAEDLEPFNKEEIAYALRASEIPVISAVGHETDVTICDFAADVRASTPSHAAELATPDKAEIKKQLDSELYKITLKIKKKLSDDKNKIDMFASSHALSSYENQINDRRLLIDGVSSKMNDKISYLLLKKKNEFEKAAAKLEATSPLKVLSSGYAYVEKDGAPKSKAADFKSGDNIKITMNDGAVVSTVDEVILNGK